MGVIGGWVLWCGTTAGQGSCWLEILLELASLMGNGRPNHPASVSPFLAVRCTQITNLPGKNSQIMNTRHINTVLGLIFTNFS